MTNTRFKSHGNYLLEIYNSVIMSFFFKKKFFFTSDFWYIEFLVNGGRVRKAIRILIPKLKNKVVPINH